MPNPLPYDAIILGAGAAGLMCAATAGQRGRRVLLVGSNRVPLPHISRHPREGGDPAALPRSQKKKQDTRLREDDGQ